MMPVKITNRETEEFALAQPDMIRVSIKDGEVVSNNLPKYFSNYYMNIEIRKGGQS